MILDDFQHVLRKETRNNRRRMWYARIAVFLIILGSLGVIWQITSYPGNFTWFFMALLSTFIGVGMLVDLYERGVNKQKEESGVRPGDRRRSR